MKLNSKPSISDGDIDVLTVGELLIDMISNDYTDEEFSNAGFRKYFGGSPGNIVINMSKLGFKSAIVSNVGNDGFGRFITNVLQENGVDTTGVTMDDSRNTSMVVVSKSKKSPSFIAYRDADKNINITDNIISLVKKTKILHFTSWPISYEPARSTTLEIIDIAKGNGKIVSFDPNYRKILWEKGHDGVKFIKELLKKVDIVKPSEDDVKEIFGEDTYEGYIKRFLDLGVKLVMLTLGEKGVMVSDGRELLKIPTLAKKVVDTTGAGDAFWSGFYAGLLQGRTVKEAILVGSAVSAYKLEEVGAIAKLPHIEEIEKLYNV